MKISTAAFAILFPCLGLFVFAAEMKTNLNDISSDIVVPQMMEGKPSAGKRVKHNWSEENNTAIHHALYLPENWTAKGKWPVIIEFAGNGGFKNNLGDVSLGTVEGCSLGYGITKGRNAIWACLPFVDSKNKQNATTWWGDADATVEYTIRSVKNICEQYQGDPDNIILAGFSRGSIACTYIGLRNEEIAKLWKGLICHSHIDGVTRWPYKDSDKESALVRWQRLQGRAAFISQEVSVAKAREFLTNNKVSGSFTFMDLPFPNHSDKWVLKDLDERKKVQAWFEQIISTRSKGS